MRQTVLPLILMVTCVLAGCATAAPTVSPRPSATPTALLSPTATPSPTQAPTPAPTAIDLSLFLPAGSYTAEIPDGLEAAPGKWRITIGTTQITWTNPQNGATFGPGNVVDVTSDTIVFAPDPQCPGQGSSPTTGSYRWHSEGENLIFEVVADSCLGRRDNFTGAPWVPAN